MTAAIIPAYEPDEKLEQTALGLARQGFGPIIIVDDGSSEERKRFFGFAETMPGCVLLRHGHNMGKGQALKTAFRWLLEERPEEVGAVTVDADGQHRPEDARRCSDALEASPGALILGSRDFTLPNVPPKSRFGNRLTSLALTYCCGVRVTDTQTGLRAIPASFMAPLLETPGERYEFETNMLLLARERSVPIKEIPIETVYFEQNRATHFRPIVDSWRIYKPLLKFFSSSIVCAAVDIGLFALIEWLGGGLAAGTRYFVATAGARAASSLLNFTLNRRVVFKSGGRARDAIWRYYLLAAGQMLASWCCVWAGTAILPIPAPVVKLIVDTLLFLVSYKIQQGWVFKRKTENSR